MAWRIPSAIRCTCSSDSITHGPAMSTSAPLRKLSKSIATEVLVFHGLGLRLGRHGFLRLSGLGKRRDPLPPVFVCRPDEGLKQRMRFQRFRFELRMELAAQIPRMVRDLTNLDIRAVRRLARNAEAHGR